MESTLPARISPDYPLQPLEDKITELWAHINAATYRWLKHVAEYDAAEGWGSHGCASCAHWLNWQCGIGMVAAREKVRVARALESLPQISASFEKGEISYSKVRAMARAATPKNEAILLNVALHGTAAHVERIVREFRRVERFEEARLAMQAHQHRYVEFRYDDDGSVFIRARLPAEVGEMIKQAIHAADQVLYKDDSAESPGPGPSYATDESRDEKPANPIGARRADALAHLAESFLQAESEMRGSSDRYLVTVHIDHSELAVDDSAESPGPGLRTSVPGPGPSSVGGRGRSEIEEGPRLAAATARRLGCDSPVVGIVEDDDRDPLNIGRRTRAIPPSMKRALASRDGGCRFPSCNRTQFTEGHHIHHWADGGETSLDNLITLCHFHHRLLHEGGFGLRRTDDGLYVFSRPDGSRIEATGRFRGIVAGEILPTLSEREGLEIGPHTIRSRWAGERMDSDLAINAMMRVRERPHYLDDR